MKFQDVEQATHMQVTFELAEVVKNDSRFTPVKVWIAHTGKNLNKSYFSKEMLESMIPSLSMIPIVGFVQTDSSNKDDFAGHEERIVVTVDGVQFDYLGRMYGFLPESHNARFESKVVNGVEREYLVADGIIVNKFAKAKEILDRDGEKSQSMELVRETFEGYYEKENDQFVVTKAEFDALCFLGDKKLPAMVGGAIEKVQFSAIKYELKEMMKEFKLEFEKGGDELTIEQLNELLVNYSYVKPEFVAEISEKLTEYETVEALEEVLKVENETQFALTVYTQMEMLGKAVSDLESYRDRWGDDRTRYYMKDAKLEEGQVFCVDRVDYTDVGMAFTKSGEEFVIDKTSAFKVAWQPIVLGEGQSARFEIAKDIKESVDYTITKFEEVVESTKVDYEAKLEAQKTEFEAQLETANSELESLRKYKADIELQTKTEYVNNVENLEADEKSELIGRITEFTAEQLVDEVAKIIGKKNIKFSAGEKMIDTINRYNGDNIAAKSFDYMFESK